MIGVWITAGMLLLLALACVSVVALAAKLNSFGDSGTID